MANDGETCHPALTTKKMRLFFVLLFLRLDVSFLFFCFFFTFLLFCVGLFFTSVMCTQTKWQPNGGM